LYKNHKTSMTEPQRTDVAVGPDPAIATAATPPTVVRVDPDPSPTHRAMRALEDDLNAVLGFYWWKKYVAAAFWSNVSTPVNLAITLLTALTTAQATTQQGLFSERAYVGTSIAALVLSVLNTFFRPHQQMSEAVKTMKRWSDFGAAFEAVYYSDGRTPEDWARRLQAYRALHAEIQAFKSEQTPEQQNFLTDLMHIVVRATCLGPRARRERWMEWMTEGEEEEASRNP
jgi:hypothetical protein